MYGAGPSARSRSPSPEGSAIGTRSSSPCTTSPARARDGRSDEARAPLAESLETAVELGYRGLIGTCLEAFAELSLADGRAERDAGRLIGAAGALLDELGVDLGPEEQEGDERTAALLEGELGPDLLGRLRAEGRTLELEPAIAMALRARGEHPASEP